MSVLASIPRASSVDIVEGQFDSFFDAGFRVHRENPIFVSPLRGDLARALDPRLNPTFAPGDITFFTATRDGQPVGRVTAQIHRASNARWQTQRASFGYFDCIDDLAVAGSLLDAAARFARARGATELVGNFNLTANQNIGVVVDGFDRPTFVDQAYNASHVPALLEALGFERTFPIRTFEVDLARVGEPFLRVKQRELIESGRFRFRTVNRLKLNRQLEQFRAVLNDAFYDNPMFVPMTREEFQFQARDLMWVVDPRISVLAYEGDTPVGAIVCIPDLNGLFQRVGSELDWRAVGEYLRFRCKNRRCLIVFAAVNREHQNTGLNGVMMQKLCTRAVDAGYERLGCTWVSDENVKSVRQTEKIGAEPLHRVYLYRRALGL